MECDSHCVATAYLIALIAAILGTTIYCTVFLSIERRPVPRPRRKRVAPRPEIPRRCAGRAGRRALPQAAGRRAQGHGDRGHAGVAAPAGITAGCPGDSGARPQAAGAGTPADRPDVEGG